MEHLFDRCNHPTEKLHTFTGAAVLDAGGREPMSPRSAYGSVPQRRGADQGLR
jgi:hypothetical protein